MGGNIADGIIMMVAPETNSSSVTYIGVLLDRFVGVYECVLLFT